MGNMSMSVTGFRYQRIVHEVEITGFLCYSVQHSGDTLSDCASGSGVGNLGNIAEL